MPEGNSSFSLSLKGFQTAWDSTSLGAFKKCPRFYYYSIVLGLQGREDNIHLEFGLGLHGASETYNHARARGASHDAAVLSAVRWALSFTWDSKLKRPRAVFCDDPNKNRFTLIRTIVWYFEQYKEDHLETIILSNGKPAVELSFRMDLGFFSKSHGEPILYCGHMDRLAKMGDTAYVLDIKSTKSTISDDFFKKFTPHGQFTGYTLAGKVEFNVPVRGIICDAAQVAVSFSRFKREPIPRDEAQLDEFLDDTRSHIAHAEECALCAHWPQNDASCDNYGGCIFREVCSKSPLTRDRWIQAGFKSRVWDPLQRRGDI